MKVVFLLALVGFTSAFDFPEDWEAWKQVGDVCHGRANILVGEGSASVVEEACKVWGCHSARLLVAYIWRSWWAGPPTFLLDPPPFLLPYAQSLHVVQCSTRQ